VVSGSFELSRLRDLFADEFESAGRRAEGEIDDAVAPRSADSPEEYDLHEDGHARGPRENRDTRDDPTALRLPEHYESTTLGGLVSEIAGHIPLPGEVIEEEGLRLEVLASTDRRIDRIRVSLAHPPATA
jgi:hypothetical protein